MSIHFRSLRLFFTQNIIHSNRFLKPQTISLRLDRRMSTPSNEVTKEDNLGLLSIFEQNPKRFERIKFLGNLYQANGYELRIAGGAVRDILRGTEPSDIDFATTARPEQSLEILQRHEDILRIIVTAAGQMHGTVAVKFKTTDVDLKRIKLDHERLDESDQASDINAGKPAKKPEYDEESPFEITTLRCDNVTDGRHAKVQFINDWRIDAERRDLTINAIFLTLNDGKLVDYFDGESDLKNGIIRFVGSAELRIQEDYLRILRYFRFWSRYGRHKQPDSETLDVIRRNFRGLDKISGERIWVEIKKIFGCLPCLEVMKLMLDSGLFNHIGMTECNTEDKESLGMKILEEAKIVQGHLEKYYDKILEDVPDNYSSNQMNKKIKELLPVIMYSTTVRDEDTFSNAHARMKFSNIERDLILNIVNQRAKPIEAGDLKFQLAMLHKSERPQALLRIRALLIYQGKFELIDGIESWQVPEFPLTGTDVAKEVRKRKLPSTNIKTVLEELKISWAASDYTMEKDELSSLLLVKVDELSTKRD